MNYWTDNGAYYYYNSDNYEDTIKDITNQGLPLTSVQIDSWWYYKDGNGAVLNWTATPETFPNGLQPVFAEISTPFVGHNRWWSGETTYAAANGGNYDFVIDQNTAVPMETRFWDDLFHNSTQWGLIMYEQDWLNVQTEYTEVFAKNVTAARDWLLQMGAGAENNNMNILYSMAWPRHMLQSVEIPAVTNIRVSDDYRPGNYQWDIGVTSIYSYALGLAPFKDSFWSTDTQPGSPYGNDTEFRTDLQSLIATMSTGIVGIGDKGLKFEKIKVQSINTIFSWTNRQ